MPSISVLVRSSSPKGFFLARTGQRIGPEKFVEIPAYSEVFAAINSGELVRKRRDAAKREVPALPVHEPAQPQHKNSKEELVKAPEQKASGGAQPSKRDGK